MSRENVEAVRAIYEGWQRGDFRTGVELYDPHIVLVTRPDLPEVGRYVGLESIRAFMRNFLEPFANVTWTPEEFIEADNSVVVVTRQEGSAKESGISMETRHFVVWTFRGRALIRLEFFADRATAFEAVGLSER
jgi:ketosteroid isomerase-like protein